LARSGLARLVPVPWHDRGKRIQFEIEVGMTRGNHFVIDEFILRAQMAFEALFRARNDTARINHVELDRLGVLFGRILCSVLAEPTLRWTVAALAANAFPDGKGPAALLLAGVQRVAGEAFRCLLGFRAQLQDASHPFADVLRKNLIRAAVLVLQDPR